MTRQPGVVSVVIPAYNAAQWIEETIATVLAQTYRPLDVIVVDDGSMDETRSAVKKFDDQIRYIHQPNSGVGAARNTGIRSARGEYVAFLDADDLWDAHKVEEQIALLHRCP